jgi:hypothetical protein
VISIKSNFQDVLDHLVGVLSSIADVNGPALDKVMRAVTADTITKLHDRIHVQGKNTAGQEFGTYSNKYLELRRQNGLSGSKIILRFEGQLEKLTIVAGQSGKYSIGWLSEFNAQKAEHMETRFGPIWSLSQSEIDHAVLVAEDEIKQILEA